MLGRFIWNPIGALVVGVLALGLGVLITTGVDVACRTKTAPMAAGVTCVDRSDKTLTFEDWQAAQQQYSWAAFGLGGVLVVGGTIAVMVRRKRRAAERAAEADRQPSLKH